MKFSDLKQYCNSLTRYSRLETREVSIGSIPLGGKNPIRIQSMTTTDTMDTIKTVEQTIRMVEAGCEYVRITAPSINEAKNLGEIKKELKLRGYDVPLIADIHFTPNAAEMAARLVEKVRVNPGNYVDKKKFNIIEYTDAEYQAELDRIRERFTPLVKICKEYGTVMRIGTNHGSLSDRIMSRYGDTPLGMVESALEFLRICEDNGYHNIVLSMKASNTQVMVQAYRLLIQKMHAEGMQYPLHLGVTEAGGGEDGRIKSAVGIGTLLEDGIGDTIRVSLTEDPEFEAPVAIGLASRYTNRDQHAPIPEIATHPGDPFGYSKRKSREMFGIGGENVPRVIADFSRIPLSEPSQLASVGYLYDEPTDKWKMSDASPDFIYLGGNAPGFDLPNGLRPVVDYPLFQEFNEPIGWYPMLSAQEFLSRKGNLPVFSLVQCTTDVLYGDLLDALKQCTGCVLVLQSKNQAVMPDLRRAMFELVNQGVEIPVVVKLEYDQTDEESFRLHAATDLGGLLIDGLGDGVWIATGETFPVSTESINRIVFGILQAARTRISKTEYIACPSCGRTLFDLQETTEKIRKRTEHLKGVKIAIMGCIVNGPGEMADADYGYVGSGPGKITLYRGKEVVTKSIQTESAVDELIKLIREDGRWVDIE